MSAYSPLSSRIVLKLIYDCSLLAAVNGQSAANAFTAVDQPLNGIESRRDAVIDSFPYFGI